MIKRFLSAAILAMACFINASADAEWVDVTDRYITNSTFDSNTDGWNIALALYNNGGFQSATYTNGSTRISRFIEAWYPSNSGTLGNGSIYTEAKIPEGKYRLEADIIATRQSSNWTTGNSNIDGVYLFAQTYAQENGVGTKVTTQDGKPQHFSLDFDMDNSGGAFLGICLNAGHGANWVAADNFTLKRYMEIVPLVGLNISPETLQLEVGETAALELQYIPSNATYPDCSWYSSDNSVVTVDKNGNVKAVGKGTAMIRAVALNGNITASCSVTVTYTPPTAGQLAINEIQVSNIDMFLDPSFNYGSWIEIYNTSSKAVTLGNLYITDDATNLTKHHLTSSFGAVPANGFKTIWFDHYGIWNTGELNQVNFKLSYDGGTIIISDGTTILAEQTYPAAINRASYARTTDGGSEWSYSAYPTPEASNSGMTFAKKQLADPVIDTTGRMFTNNFTFNVTIPSGQTLRYTLDGSLPTLENGKTSADGSFSVNTNDGNKAYRFRLFQDGYLPSNPIARTFIYNNSSNYVLPVIAIQTDNTNLYSRESGIFMQGPNSRPGNGQSSNCNWNMDWDRPVNFEYMDLVDGTYTTVLNQEVMMSMCGGWSRAWSPHSFKLKADKQYSGKNSMDYQFFASKPFLKHKTLQIRNGGNDTSCRIKDAALQEIVRRSGLYVDCQAWQPVEVFINGSFYAVINMREPNNKHFATANYGLDTDFMDQFEMSPDSGYVQKEGTSAAFDRLVELSYSASDADKYAEIGKLLDIDEYINNMAVEFYLGNWDWPQNNVKGFRSTDDGKFHFVIFDLDGSFSTSTPFSTFMNKQYYTFDNLYGEDALGNSYAGKRNYAEIKFVTLFKNLLKNSEFRKKFVDSYCIIAGSVFEPSRCSEIINEMASTLSSAGVSPWNTANTLISNLSSYRQSMMVGRLKNDGTDFGVSSVNAQTVSLASNVEEAHLLVNGIPVPTDKFSGQLFAPATITAVAPAGYKFCGWAGNGTKQSNDITLFQEGATWSYYDQGGLDGEDWKSADYPASWASGASPLGYGKSTVKTTLTSYLQTYYFSKSVNLSDTPSEQDVFTLNYTIDDAMVVYVNGVEAGRENLPSGTITSSTNATTYAYNNPNTGTMTLPANLFKKGQNVIAVEVHNYLSPSSTDILWDAELLQTHYSTADNEYVSTEATIEMPKNGEVSLTAIYKKASEIAGVSPVRINEVSASNEMFVDNYFKKDDWVELYNTTDADIDVNGWYISDNLSKPKKFQITNADGENTIVPAHGYLVVWASKRNATADMIHASFKLGNSDGSVVLLTNKDATLTDALRYDVHTGWQSIGRYPDGGNDVYCFDIPTIHKDNILTSYAQYVYTQTYAKEEGDTTGIYAVTSDKNGITLDNAEFFTLTGTRISRESAHGIVIVKSNGVTRKVRVRK